MESSVDLNRLMTLKDFEAFAVHEKMSKNAKLYFSVGACSLDTPRQNEEAFERYYIRPRVLRDVSEAKMDCDILNSTVSCPIGFSPTGLHALVHPEGELATVRGCCKEGCVFILSPVASSPLEAVIKEVSAQPNRCLWMQVYIHRNRSVTLDLIKRAESFGFSAIVVTLDSPNSGLWRNVMPKEFFQEVAPLLSNLPCLPRFLEDASVNFEDLKWVTGSTKLPVIAKGILTGEDAREAVQCGASAIIVSNHGGRLLQRVVPPINVLEEIVDAVKDTGVEVYLDGGIRSGTDIFVALALGAKAVFLGRPPVWGLTVDGENGVRKILQILKDEFFSTMQLAGISRVEDIDRSMVTKM